MQEVTKYPAGTFSWVDLSTTDAAGAKKFYSELFGWGINDIPIEEGIFYTMLTLEGKDVAALSQMSPEQQEQGMPPMWNSYVTVESAAAAAAKAKELGGNVMMGPFDVMDKGRMAVIQDPTGAVFSVWQAGTSIGAKYVNVPGSLTWNELVTNDTDKAGEFYTGLFGWEIQSADTGDMLYHVYVNQGRMNAGMMAINEQMEDVPPHWMVYFSVADCDATVQKAESLGGKTVVPAQDIPETGRFAMLQDPQGGMFAVIKILRIDPPPGA